VVELGNSFPAEWKINARGRKLILKETFSDLLPDSILNRPKKGFEVPLEKWLRGPLQPIVYGLLTEDELKSTGLFDHHGVHHLLQDFYGKGYSQHTELIYALTTFMQWYKTILSENQK
jgi:asparagine synthase (glutamine-hydrolysing)